MEVHEEPHCEDPDFNVLIIVFYIFYRYILFKNFTSRLIDDRWMQITMNPEIYRQNSLKIQKGENEGNARNSLSFLAQEKSKFNPKQFLSCADYFDQYYSLDYEDMIGDYKAYIYQCHLSYISYGM